MSDTSRGRLAYFPEATYGTTPNNPNLQTLRLTSSDLAYNKETTQSSELDSGRMLTDVPEVGASSTGSLNLEWSPGSYDALIEAALGGTRSAKITLEDTIAISADPVGTATITDSGANGYFTTSNIEAGQWVLLTGFNNDGNNGWFEVASRTGDDIIVVNDPAEKMVNESATSGSKLVAQTIKNGVTERSFIIEESYLDVFKYRLFNGMRIGSMSMDLSTGAIATGSFGMQGTTATIESEADGTTEPSWVGTGTRQAALATSVMNATSNVGDIYIDGSLSSACFQSLSLNLDNTLRSLMCIGSKYPTKISYGRQTVSGNITNLFKDWTLYQKMLDHEDISLSFGLIAPAGQGGIHFYLPRVTLSTDTVNLSGGNDSDVTESLDWSALRHADGYQIRIDIAS